MMAIQRKVLGAHTSTAAHNGGQYLHAEDHSSDPLSPSAAVVMNRLDIRPPSAKTRFIKFHQLRRTTR